MELEQLEVNLFVDVCKLVEEAKSFVAHTANQSITMLYWKIGERINSDLLDGKRAKYGRQIVSQLATQLKLAYIWGLTLRYLNLRNVGDAFHHLSKMGFHF
jgi:DUF1016 N-terminal domain